MLPKWETCRIGWLHPMPQFPITKAHLGVALASSELSMMASIFLVRLDRSGVV